MGDTDRFTPAHHPARIVCIDNRAYNVRPFARWVGAREAPPDTVADVEPGQITRWLAERPDTDAPDTLVTPSGTCGPSTGGPNARRSSPALHSPTCANLAPSSNPPT
jgi:hypothetical protein